MDVESIVYAAIETLRPTDAVPNPHTRGRTSTGNLAFNALRYYREGNTIVLYIDEAIAPYMPYTNEPWTSKRWNGKPNPNEGWFKRFAQALAAEIANRTKGKVTEATYTEV